MPQPIEVNVQQVVSSSQRVSQAAKVLRAPTLLASSSSRMSKVTQLEIMQLESQNAVRQTAAQIVF